MSSEDTIAANPSRYAATNAFALPGQGGTPGVSTTAYSAYQLGPIRADAGSPLGQLFAGLMGINQWGQDVAASFGRGVDLVANHPDAVNAWAAEQGQAGGRAPGGLIGGAVEYIGNLLGTTASVAGAGVGEGAGAAVEGIGTGVGDAATAAGPGVGAGVGAGVQGIGTGVGTALTVAGPGVGTGLGAGLAGLGSGLGSAIGNTAPGLTAGLGNLFGGTGSAFAIGFVAFAFLILVLILVR